MMLVSALVVFYFPSLDDAFAQPRTEALKTHAALGARFEVLQRLSFTAPHLYDSFALSVDEKVLYFTERSRERAETDLMAFDLEQGGVRVVMPLCGGPEPTAASGICTLPDAYVASLPGDPRRLLAAQADRPQPYSSVFVLDLVTGDRLAIQLGAAARRALLESNGIDPALGTNADMQVSPSGKYLLAALQLVEVNRYYDETDYGVFSLETGKREFLYHVPVRVVGDHEETGLSTAWWESSDVVIVKRWGGKEETFEAFQRGVKGTWRKRTTPSRPQPTRWWPRARRFGGDWAIVGTDAQDRGGFLIEGDLLFSNTPGLLYALESRGKIVVLKVVHSLTTEDEVNIVVLRPKPARGAS